MIHWLSVNRSWFVPSLGAALLLIVFLDCLRIERGPRK